MKSIAIILVMLVSLSSATGCKTKKAGSSTSTATSSSSSTPGVSVTTNTSTTETNTTASGDNQGAYVGKVSHKYRAAGCETVIVFNGEDGAEVTLIPKDKLSKDVDVDGQILKFDYRPLKMPQPAGCTVGIPAEISNITKLK